MRARVQPDLRKRGVTLTALFDVNKDIVGSVISGYTVLHMDKLDDYVASNKVDIAVLTLPKEVVRETAEHLASLGIKGLWNFASTEIELEGSDVVVQNVHMGDSLMTLCYELTKHNQDDLE